MEKDQQQPEGINIYDEAYLINRINHNHHWADLDSKPDLTKPQSFYAQFPPGFQILYKRFHYLKQADETSRRAFDLTQILLIINSSNFYALMMRENCLPHIELNYPEEFDFVCELLRSNSKQYAVWTYRKTLFQRANNLTYTQSSLQSKAANSFRFEQEIQFLEELLQQDNKNYHVWSYRLWLAETTKRYAEDLKRVETMLKESLYASQCYSAWHYKRELVQRLQFDRDREFVVREISMALEWLAGPKQQAESERKSLNECVWNYLQSYFVDGSNRSPAPVTYKFSEFPQVEESTSKIDNRFSLYFQLKIAQQKQDVQRQRQIIKVLLEKDTTRQRYYEYLLRELSKNI